MRALAITGIETASWMPLIITGSLMRATPPSRRMSAGTRSSAITADAPASSAILACSASTTSMITPPLSISASPALTRNVASSRMRPSLGAWKQLHDGDRPPRARGALAVGGIAGKDAVGQRPQPPALRLVGHHPGPERLAAEDDVGVGPQVVKPRRVLREAELRRDDRHPLAVVEVDDPVAPRLPAARASRLQQRRGQQQPEPDPSAGQPEQQRIELPDDRPRHPAHHAGARQPRVRAIQRAAGCERIDVT